MSSSTSLEDLPHLLGSGTTLEGGVLKGGRWVDDLEFEQPITLVGCTFDECNFASAPLGGMRARRCSFHRCSFRLADLSEAHFDQCSFYDPDSSEGCSFELTNLEGAGFSDCNLNMCDLSRARLYRIEMLKCQVQGARLYLADATHRVSDRVVLTGGMLRDCNLSYSDLSGANLRECDLSASRLNHSTLDEACLAAANLTDCDLTAVEAHHLDLRDADLRDAIIAGIDLRKIDLTGVKIKEWQQRYLLETVGLVVESD